MVWSFEVWCGFCATQMSRSVLVVSGEERFQLPWVEIEKCFGIGGLLGGEGAKPERRWGRLFGVG